MSERSPITVDKKFRRASALATFVGGAALTVSGCGEPERLIHDGNLVDKWYEPERTYIVTNISIDFDGNPTTSFRSAYDDEDWGITIENCLPEPEESDCLVKSYYVTEELYDSKVIGDRVLITENPEVISEPFKRRQ